MTRRFAIILALAIWLPRPAAADALDIVLSGTWGSPVDSELRCRDNAKTPELVAPDLLRFHYRAGIWFPPGTWTRTLDYRILARGDDWLHLSIPNEYRKHDGALVVWILQFEGTDRFVWKVRGDPSGESDNPQVRCPGPAAVS